MKAEIHHSNDIGRWDFKQVHTFCRASNELPPLAGTIKFSATSGRHTWLTPVPRPHFTHRWRTCFIDNGCTGSCNDGETWPAAARALCCCTAWLSGHLAFVTWDMNGEYKSELSQLKRWRIQCELSKAYVKSGFGQARGCNCCQCAYAWQCTKLSAYQLLLPLNPTAAPACCMARGSAGVQRRAKSQTGLDLVSVREKIEEQPHYLLWLQSDKIKTYPPLLWQPPSCCAFLL